jgi:hypothetical protein
MLLKATLIFRIKKSLLLWRNLSVKKANVILNNQMKFYRMFLLYPNKECHLKFSDHKLAKFGLICEIYIKVCRIIWCRGVRFTCKTYLK